MKIECNGQVIEVTANHPASSYDQPVVLLDGKVTNYRYSEDVIANIPDDITHKPAYHNVTIDGEIFSARQWATRQEIVLSLGFYGVLGTITMQRN